MPIFRVKSVKIYTGQKKFTRAPAVVLVTNMRYERMKNIARLWELEVVRALDGTDHVDCYVCKTLVNPVFTGPQGKL